ncbi:hypothetical protein COV17_02910 [Candidatus Woesearchaeota archaeon CG10_big_fil_rev_8_21_14_0_10_36_11]|nr:MAG: hypothetical protein COV17_02910 [Candidatus Woesearchaeota archaeon CG10_big_fil_rev_8_21_14_0_10_36_11]
MQAVILAAGKGTRIYPMGLKKPKPLIEVANKPVLEHNLDQMVGFIEEAIIIVGYKKDMIINHLGNNYRGIKLMYVVQEEQLGTAHAVLLAEHHVHGKFLVLNGDDLFSRKDMLAISQCNNCLLVQYKEDASAFGAVVLKDGFVQDIVEKSETFVSHFVNTGMYCFMPDVFSILHTIPLSARGEYELTDAVKEIAKQGKMHAEEVQGHWIPVGYPWHILEASEALLGERNEISIRGTLGENVTITGSLDVGEGSTVGECVVLRGNIVVGKNCTIGKNVIITGFTAIGDNTVIENGAHLHNVIIGAGATLKEECVVKDSVLGTGSVLSKGVRIANISKDATVKVKSNGLIYDSGKEKLGAFVGDECVIDDELGGGDCVGD